MEIVSWDCNGGLRNKVKWPDALEADVSVVQECEDPKESTAAYRDWAGEYLWVGSSKHKGIGLFPKHGHTVSGLPWDKQDRWWNHSSVVAELKQLGITSLYHQQKGEEQGQEKAATFFHQRNSSKAYHIDLCVLF
ncbi:MAG: hypothetical protein AUK35_10295 [Zetaproteobacteria bacterium CG2_30_46_52]|nr:MAG: hypothetical protein AUK35_10295 [Zetaproteobacteria bacterium CG2_30_46_52]